MSHVTSSLQADLVRRARRILPGGVDSPVRAFGAVGGSPVVLVRGAGPWVWDADGRRYLDLVGAWGAAILARPNDAR